MPRTATILLMALAVVVGGCLFRPAAVPGPAFVFFSEGSVELTPDARAVVQQAAADFSRVRGRSSTVNGYADITGPSDENFALSDQRADAVERALIAAGVEPARIVKVAYGEVPPQAPGVGGRRVGIQINR